MNWYISLALAAQRARDLRYDANVDRHRRAARQARRAARGLRRHGRAPHGSRAPESYEDFLRQTAPAAMREPTAAGRSQGQPVR